VVERTFSWFGRNRRLTKNFENLTEILTTFATLASIQLALKRLARAWVWTQQRPVEMLEVRNRQRFPLPRASGRCGFGEVTFAGTHGNDQDAPIPVIWLERDYRRVSARWPEQGGGNTSNWSGPERDGAWDAIGVVSNRMFVSMSYLSVAMFWKVR
jgi:hypothetical protein